MIGIRVDAGATVGIRPIFAAHKVCEHRRTVHPFVTRIRDILERSRFEDVASSASSIGIDWMRAPRAGAFMSNGHGLHPTPAVGI